MRQGSYEVNQTFREPKFFQSTFYDIKQHQNVMVKSRLFRF